MSPPISSVFYYAPSIPFKLLDSPTYYTTIYIYISLASRPGMTAVSESASQQEFRRMGATARPTLSRLW